MKIIVNGLQQEINQKNLPITLTEVIEELGHNPHLIVVEFNDLIVNKANWNSQEVKAGDKLEIVTIVGGGS